jgi:hypothetical protein
MTLFSGAGKAASSSPTSLQPPELWVVEALGKALNRRSLNCRTRGRNSDRTEPDRLPSLRFALASTIRERSSSKLTGFIPDSTRYGDLIEYEIGLMAMLFLTQVSARFILFSR